MEAEKITDVDSVNRNTGEQEREQWQCSLNNISHENI